jgi:DNA-binding protein HU-beta
MNKKELIDQVTEGVDVQKQHVRDVIEETINVMMKALVKGEKVSLVGFGSFEPRKKPPREGRDPVTHQVIQIPSSIHVGFKMGDQLKKRIRK